MTPQLFLAEEKALRTDHEQEYSVFTEVPEMHPEYEAKYEQFVTCYRKRTGNAVADSGLEDEVWSTYWIEELEKLKKDEWKEKRKKLVEKFKLVLQEKRGLKPAQHAKNLSPKSTIPALSSDSVLMQSLAFSSNSVSKTIKPLVSINPVDFKNASLIPKVINTESKPQKVSKVFNAEYAFQSIVGMCGSLGILGTALKDLIGMARNAGSTTNSAIKIFTDSDNTTLIKMSIEKCKNLLKTTPSNSMILVKGITAAEELMQEAEKLMMAPNLDVEKEYDTDIRLIAKATVGKNPAEILSFINSSLAFEGKTVTNDELTKIYLSISAHHMNMTLASSSHAATTTVEPTFSQSSSCTSSLSMAMPQSTQSAAAVPFNSPKNIEMPCNPSKPVSGSIPSTSMPSNFPPNSNSILQASMAAAASSDPISFTLSTSTRKPSIAKNTGMNNPPPSMWNEAPPPSYCISPSSQPLYNNQPPPLTKTVSKPTVPVAGQMLCLTPTVAGQSDDSWFVQQVKCALSDPNISIEKFNKELATIFSKKPRNYQFSASDLNLASELQQLGTSTTTGESFISTLKKILKV